MKILAIDPGETVGLALFHTDPLQLVNWSQEPLDVSEDSAGKMWEWSQVYPHVLVWLWGYDPDVIVLEDYRVYSSTANAHIGSRVLTSELIGAVCLESAFRKVPVVRISASKKGRWPAARLRKKFPAYEAVPKPHCADAVVLGLVYAEQEGYYDGEG